MQLVKYSTTDASSLATRITLQIIVFGICLGGGRGEMRKGGGAKLS
jgi:hypothetical protein